MLYWEVKRVLFNKTDDLSQCLFSPNYYCCHQNEIKFIYFNI